MNGEQRARRRLQLLAVHWRNLADLAARKGAGHLAEDLASEAIMRAAWSESIDEETPLPYLQRTVQNLVVDQYRHAVSLTQLSFRMRDAPGVRSTEDSVADIDLAMRALRRLRDKEGPFVAMLVWRRIVDEAPWSELALEVGMSPSKIQSIVWRAIHALRPWLSRQLRYDERSTRVIQP